MAPQLILEVRHVARRLVITAVTVEGHSKSQAARDYGVTRFWVQTLVKRYEVEVEAAYEPRSRRPRSNPRAVNLEVVAWNAISCSECRDPNN